MSDSLTTETATTQAAPDYVNEREEGRKALKELLKPVQGTLYRIGPVGWPVRHGLRHRATRRR